MDVHDKKTRSRNMSRIRGANTRPELLIRRGLHKMGFRYRLHCADLPGKPDMVFPKYRAIILIHGCFWHQHECHLFKWPESRREFWIKKISETRARDERNARRYRELGWRVLVIWECALKGKNRDNLVDLLHTAANWIQFDRGDATIEGRKWVTA